MPAPARRTRTALLAAVLLAALPPASLRADEPQQPAPSAAAPEPRRVLVRLEAARYAPTETDFHWSGWIGARADLVRRPRGAFALRAEVETILGHSLRSFEAVQANYHLELIGRRTLARGDLELFFHHVSRHYVDRPKEQAVDWNILGLRAHRYFDGRVPARLALGVGHATLSSLVRYRLEVTAGAEVVPLHGPAAEGYAGAEFRGVTTTSTPEFPRRSFADVAAEVGVRWPHPERPVSLFVAVERRNDVQLEFPSRRDRALFGFRIGRKPF